MDATKAQSPFANLPSSRHGSLRMNVAPGIGPGIPCVLRRLTSDNSYEDVPQSVQSVCYVDISYVVLLHRILLTARYLLLSECSALIMQLWNYLTDVPVTVLPFFASCSQSCASVTHLQSRADFRFLFFKETPGLLVSVWSPSWFEGDQPNC